MRTSRFTEEQIVGILQEHAAGAKTGELVRRHGIGRGIGRLLLDAALAFLTTRGAPRVVLTTAEGNDAARRLFAHAGFRRTMIEMTRELDDRTS